MYWSNLNSEIFSGEMSKRTSSWSSLLSTQNDKNHFLVKSTHSACRGLYSAPADRATETVRNVHRQKKCCSFQKLPIQLERILSIFHELVWLERWNTKAESKHTDVIPQKLTNSMEQSPSSEVKSTLSYSRNSPHFMEPELPFPQELATCPYPEPIESNPHPQTVFAQDQS
jgi:hypothetical protein